MGTDFRITILIDCDTLAPLKEFAEQQILYSSEELVNNDQTKSTFVKDKLLEEFFDLWA